MSYDIVSLFRNSKSAVVLIVIFVTLFFLGIIGLSKCAHAADATDAPYMQLSGGSTYIRGIAPVVDLGATWPSIQAPRNFWKLDLDLIGSSTFKGHGAPNNFVARALYVGGFDYVDFGLGLGWLQNPRPFNGSPVNFTLEIAYRARIVPVTFTISHISNAGTRYPNYGRDMITVGYRFR